MTISAITEQHTVQVINLPWQPDAAQYYAAALSQQPWTMLLHSGFARHPDNRFDILVAAPLISLQTRDGVTEIIDNTTVNHTSVTPDNNVAVQPQHSTADPLQLLSQYLAKFPSLVTSEDLPFQGGAVGLFGYDLARQIEKLPQLASADLHTPDMAVAIYDWALIVDHHKQRLCLVSINDPTQRLTWLQRQHAVYSQSCPSHASHNGTFHLTSDWQSIWSRQQYGEKFRQVQRYLLAGDCYQVNLAQRFSASYCGDEWQAFYRLNAACRAPFSAFVRLPHQAILSLSPERFLLLRQGNIQSRPIKGTLPRLPDPLADAQQAQRLAASTKDRAENLMIVDLLRNDIGRVALPGSVRVPELFTVECFTTVHHLVSTITARLQQNLCACDLLRACFPGGSITGAPKIRAMEIIEELEPVRRNAWCGSIGYISFCGNMDSNITIRTLIAENQRLYCSAGGGIVADSDEQAEYQETLTKIESMLTLLRHDTVTHATHNAGAIS